MVRKSEVVYVKLDPETLASMDRMIAMDSFSSRSHLARYAIKMLLAKAGVKVTRGGTSRRPGTSSSGVPAP